ncbi:MAG TPA: enoyl-CoA hydratase [Oxalicibacterium sp.]|nr:enoyl-CoA hydratase [Oxalicibacterium sp.]
MSAELLASRHEATLILTVSNPGSRNALHPDMFAAAVETLSTAERDDTIRAVVLTGADNFFCSGGNLRKLLEQQSQSKVAQAEMVDGLRGWIEAIRDCPKPVIAAVDGAAIGAGFSLALACDLIVAGMSAKFAMAYVNIGLTPDGGASWLLTQALPRQLATEILIQGAQIPASRLHELGLVNKVVADGFALREALQWADELAALSCNAVDRIKLLLREASENTLPKQFSSETFHFVESLNHPDAREGINAFLEKRTPRYQ